MKGELENAEWLASGAPGTPGMPVLAGRPPSRPNWAPCAFGRRRTPAKGMRPPTAADGCRWRR
jgi:hypothetical protein